MPSPKKYYAYILCGLFILCAAAVAGASATTPSGNSAVSPVISASSSSTDSKRCFMCLSLSPVFRPLIFAPRAQGQSRLPGARARSSRGKAGPPMCSLSIKPWVPGTMFVYHFIARFAPDRFARPAMREPSPSVFGLFA